MTALSAAVARSAALHAPCHRHSNAASTCFQVEEVRKLSTLHSSPRRKNTIAACRPAPVRVVQKPLDIQFRMQQIDGVTIRDRHPRCVARFDDPGVFLVPLDGDGPVSAMLVGIGQVLVASPFCTCSARRLPPNS